MRIVPFTLNRSRFGALVLLSAAFYPVHKPRAGTRTIPRTCLVPQNDSRDEDTRSYDDFDSRTMVEGMNEDEDFFYHRLKCC